MSHLIVSVDPSSPAARSGIKAGDRLRSINGETVIDFIDYQALSADEDLSVAVLRNGKEKVFSLDKDEYEPLGLNFESPMMSGVRLCCNKCLFCFVDQLPANVRPTMRVKDDDWRMSLMMGNYVTLTNLSDREIDRIVSRHASPLYISVHATDPDLRARILGTPRASKLMAQLKKLSDGGIEFHCQAVLCPGINDGEALEQTISDLIALPGAKSLALVPVGLTGHREGLCPLKPYSRDEARAVIEIADKWRARLLEERDTRFVFPSDEFYLQAEKSIPADEEYEDYGQIDDGVGLLRLLHTEYTDAWMDLPESDRCHTPVGTSLAIACGKSASEFIGALLKEYPISGTNISVYGLENRFFGPTVTVSGLITGRDLVDQMKDRPSKAILITECMLRNEGDRFLDDMTLEEAEKLLNRPIIPVGRRGEDLLDAILELR